MGDENHRMIERLNTVIVTKEELSDVLEESDRLHDEGTAENGDGIYLVTKMFSGQPERAQAIYFRMIALSKIIEKQSAQGWTLPSNKAGAVLTKQELIGAAATFPLSEIDGDVGFEINGFLSKALELAEIEGSG